MAPNLEETVTTASLQGVILSATNFTLSYNDTGSGADCNVQLWNPDSVGSTFLPLGDACEGSPSSWIHGTNPRGQVLVVAELPNVTGMLANPTDFTPVWTADTDVNGTVWEMVPPDGFVALGHVVTMSSSGSPPKPSTSSYWCVASSLATDATLGTQIWNTVGSDLDTAGMWRLVPNQPPVPFQDAGTFFATTSLEPTDVTNAHVLQAGVLQVLGS